MARASDNPWQRVGSALERVNVSPLPSDIPEASGRVRTNAEAARAKAKNLFHSARHDWLGFVVRDRELAGGALRVAVVIWQRINEKTGYAWPSVGYLARELKLHRTTVFRAICELEARGWLTRRSRVGKHGVNHYHIAFGLMNAGGQS